MPRADMTSLFQILMLLLSVAKFVVLAHLIMSWLVNFQVLNLRQPLVYQVWSGLNRLLEPLYGPIRRMLPNLGGIDLSPLLRDDSLDPVEFTRGYIRRFENEVTATLSRYFTT